MLQVGNPIRMFIDKIGDSKLSSDGSDLLMLPPTGSVPRPDEVNADAVELFWITGSCLCDTSE